MIMDSYTSAHFTVQPPADPAASASTEMDLDPKGEAPGGQDMDIKRETSDGIEGDTKMADIPESADPAAPVFTKSSPGSSQPPPSLPQTDGTPEDASGLSRLSAAVRASKKKGTATLVKKTTSRKAGGGSRAGKGVRGGITISKAATPNPLKTGANKKGAPGSTASASSPAPAAGSSDVGSDDGDDESDHGPYCICRGPDDHRWMISCDVCEDWFHGECVSIDKTIGEALIQRYVCPGCTDGKGVNVTRYRKTCSLEGCYLPARIYEDAGAGGKHGSLKRGGNYSVFCSDRHAEEWWEQMVRSLPNNGRLKAKEADLTRERFMGLLNASTVQQSVEGEEPWSIGKKPFAVPSELWSKVDHTLILTPEEQSFLSESAADRYALAEEIVLNKKMQQLLDLANERRKAAIAAGLIDKDTCGYDIRLDLVGCPAEFALFAKSAQGEAIYRTNGLSAENTWTDEQLQRLQAGGEGKDFNLATAGMCDRRRCKPHASWYNIFTKSTRHVIKELARQAKEKLDAETRVRDAAATRYFRRRHERTAVRRLDGMVAT